MARCGLDVRNGPGEGGDAGSCCVAPAESGSLLTWRQWTTRNYRVNIVVLGHLTGGFRG